MKNVLSRETLLSIDYYPFEDELLERLTDVGGRGNLIYLIYQCICQYMNVFAKKYELPTTCDVEKVFLTKEILFNDNEGLCNFYEEAEFNSSDLLLNLVTYCDWDCLSLTEDELQEADFTAETEESFKEQLDRTEIFTEKGKALLYRMSKMIVNSSVYEGRTLYFLSIKGLPQYLCYKKNHPKMINELFLREDCMIHSIVDSIWNVLIENPQANYDVVAYIDNDMDEFLLGWVTGSDGYYYSSIAHLNPNWVISMYVLHGLLEHAQILFGYRTGGSKKV